MGRTPILYYCSTKSKVRQHTGPGLIVASYRKMFPWRPWEKTQAGSEFCVFGIPDIGRFGLAQGEGMRHLGSLRPNDVIGPCHASARLWRS